MFRGDDSLKSECTISLLRKQHPQLREDGEGDIATGEAISSVLQTEGDHACSS